MSKVKTSQVSARNSKATLTVGEAGSTTYFHPRSTVILEGYATNEDLDDLILEGLEGSVDLNSYLTKAQAKTLYQNLIEKGVPDGYTPLNAVGKIPDKYLNLSGVNIMGIFGATKSLPIGEELLESRNGDSYICDTDNYTDPSAPDHEYDAGDMAMWNGTDLEWNKIPSTGNISADDVIETEGRVFVHPEDITNLEDKINTELDLKADITYVDSQDKLLRTYVDAEDKKIKDSIASDHDKIMDEIESRDELHVSREVLPDSPEYLSSSSSYKPILEIKGYVNDPDNENRKVNATIFANGIGEFSSVSTSRVKNLDDPIDREDAAHKGYVDALKGDHAALEDGYKNADAMLEANYQSADAKIIADGQKAQLDIITYVDNADQALENKISNKADLSYVSSKFQERGLADTSAPEFIHVGSTYLPVMQWGGMVMGESGRVPKAKVYANGRMQTEYDQTKQTVTDKDFVSYGGGDARYIKIAGLASAVETSTDFETLKSSLLAMLAKC